MPEQDVEAPLTPEEIQDVQRLLKAPLNFPPEFKSWVIDWIATNIPQLPLDQVFGGRGVPRFIAVSSQSASVGAVTAETTLYTGKVPGKRLARNGQMKVKVVFTAMCSDVTNFVELFLNLNGTRIGTSSAITQDRLDGSTRAGILEFFVYNAGTYSSQFVGGSGGFDGESIDEAIGAAGSGSVDTTQNMDLTISAQWDSAGSQLLTLRYVSIEVFNPIGIG